MVRERDQTRSNVTRAAFRDVARTFPNKTPLWNPTPHPNPNDFPSYRPRTEGCSGGEEEENRTCLTSLAPQRLNFCLDHFANELFETSVPFPAQGFSNLISATD